MFEPQEMTEDQQQSIRSARRNRYFLYCATRESACKFAVDLGIWMEGHQDWVSAIVHQATCEAVVICDRFQKQCDAGRDQ